LHWYGAKTLFRLVATGKAHNPDKYFDPALTLLEERIVLFRVKDFDDAIQQARKEARAYCKSIRYKNVYGQSVHLRFLNALDIFKMADDMPPAAGREVYSATELVANSIPDSKIVTNRFGKSERGGAQNRYKFIDGVILNKALTAMKTNPAARARPAAKRKS
jgi:hypothetical protein